MRVMLRLGIERAGNYGFVGERSVVFFSSLMLLFGSYFDEDSQHQWAKPALELESGAEDKRSAQLYRDGVEFWENVAVENNRELLGSIARNRANDIRELDRLNFVRIIEEVQPAKNRLIGSTGIDAIWTSGQAIAARHGLCTAADNVLLALLVSLLGRGFDTDPMFPWAAIALKNGNLRHAVIEYADQWLEHMKSEVA